MVQIADRRRLVRRDPGAQHIGYGNRGNDQYDRHHDQEFDKRKPFLLGHRAPAGPVISRILDCMNKILGQFAFHSAASGLSQWDGWQLIRTKRVIVNV